MPSGGPSGGDLLAERYRLIDRVGAGGMSVVWRARDEVLDRLVAVKWLGAELADDDLFRDLVRREAWATARIKHAAVAAIYDYGEVPGAVGESLAYVVMEMLDGESLSDRLRLGPVGWHEAVAMCAEIADALATAHDHGVVHRDISPNNVMLTSSGLRVFDFGIAAPIGEPDDDATGSTFGTPAYVAPERLDGQPAQTATDVYALGVLLFELLTGAPPFPEDTWDPDAARHARIAPRPRGVPGLPPAVVRLIQRCLAHEPAQRPTAREVADRLSRYGRPWFRRRPVLAGAGAAATVVLIVAVVALVSSLSPAPAATSLAAPSEAAPVVAPSTGGAVPAVGDPGGATAAGTPTSSAPVPSPTGTQPRATTSAPAGSAAAPPLAAPLTTDQALDQIRTVIATGLDQAAIRPDVALDLHTQVEAIAAKLALQPDANVDQMIDSLRHNVIVRSVDHWGPGSGDPDRPPIATSCATALLAAIDQLRTTVDPA